MKKQKGQDYSQLIIWTSALVGMIRYSAAFLSSDLGEITGVLSEWVTILLGVSGFAMGILGTLGTTYIFDGWRQKMPKTGDKWNNKFIALTLFVVLAIGAEILILVPFTMSRILHVSVADVLRGGVWWWSASVVVMPFLLIGGVSVSNQIVTVTTETQTNVTVEPRKDDGNLPETYQTNWRQIKSKLNANQIKAIATGKTEDICLEFGITDRTARNWRKNAQKELEPVMKGKE